jgi:hypothetical protein
VVNPSSSPVNLWLHGREPWVSEYGFVFSQVRKEESEIDSFVSCLDREVCVVEEIAALVRGAIYIVEFLR